MRKEGKRVIIGRTAEEVRAEERESVRKEHAKTDRGSLKPADLAARIAALEKFVGITS